MRYFINYASNGFFNSQQLGLKSAENFGFKSIGYTEKDIDEDFKSKHKAILDSKRGGGYWLWKPYIILDMLNKINDGDELVYMDSGANFIKDPSNILRMINHKGVLTFSMVQKKSKWTKGDCFYYINGEDKSNFKDENQIQGTYIFLKKCTTSVNFIKKWLDHCTSNNIITDDSNTRLDTYFKDKELDCLKIDIEGAETKAIRGGLETIKKCSLVMIECHFPKDWSEIVKMFRDNDLTFRNLLNGEIVNEDKMPYQIYKIK